MQRRKNIHVKVIPPDQEDSGASAFFVFHSCLFSLLFHLPLIWTSCMWGPLFRQANALRRCSRKGLNIPFSLAQVVFLLGS